MLINRRVKDMIPFASRDAIRPVLRNIHVGETEVTATNGQILASTPVTTHERDDSFPASDTTPITTGEVLLDVESVKQAVNVMPKRPMVPILNELQIAKAGDRVVINAGFPVVSIPVQADQTDRYPNHKQCIPDYAGCEPLKFALDGKLLKCVCDLAIKYGDSYHKIVFEVPTTNRVPALDENDCPIDDSNGGYVMRQQPLQTAVKFSIADGEGEEVFTGIIMPLLIKD